MGRWRERGRAPVMTGPAGPGSITKPDGSAAGGVHPARGPAVRRWGLIVAVLGLVLTVSGCIKYDADLVINAGRDGQWHHGSGFSRAPICGPAGVAHGNPGTPPADPLEELRKNLDAARLRRPPGSFDFLPVPRRTSTGYRVQFTALPLDSSGRPFADLAGAKGSSGADLTVVQSNGRIVLSVTSGLPEEWNGRTLLPAGRAARTASAHVRPCRSMVGWLSSVVDGLAERVAAAWSARQARSHW